ncbi:MAG: PD-(D/E)XK nuclease family protein [Patescibacteria group bacterium]
MSHWVKEKRRFLYNPISKDPFSISRSKIELFMDCAYCFYIDRKLGIGRPSMPGFSLNNAVDKLLKKEFDILRESGEKHELMDRYGIDAVPFSHPDLATWRDDGYRYVGASVLHKPTNLLVCGIIDDVWVNKKKELLLVDYKSTSTTKEISLDDEYKQSYKRQMEVYQWIFRQLGFKVNNTGYFVFANALKTPDKFDGKLTFDLSIVPHKGDGTWIEKTLKEIKKCLSSNNMPNSSENCEHCRIFKDRSGIKN